MRSPASSLARFALAAFVVSTGATTALAQATDFPTKPVRIVVPFPPGGPTDIWARLIGQRMQETWKQSVVIENRPGGTGAIGSLAVKDAPADGHTLLFTSNSAHVIAPLLREPRTFDAVRDFTPIANALRYPMYIVVNPNLPARNVQELVALARAQPGKLNYSSVGTGSGGHVACEMFNVAAGTNIVHVPYKGAAPAQAAVIGGETQMMCDSVGNSHGHVKAGKLRGIALFAGQRSSGAPEIPTLAESGFPGVEGYIWLGLFGPPSLPAPILARINAETVRIMNLPDLRDRVTSGGSEVVANTPEQFAAGMRAETEGWHRVIREKNIRAE